MIVQRDEDAGHELLALMQELAGRYWGGAWGRGMDHALWCMAHGGSAVDWPPESLPTREELRRLRDLSERAGGWWVRRDEAIVTQFVPRSMWRRHLWFSAVAIPLTYYLTWSFVVFLTLCAVTLVPLGNPTWGPVVSWPVGGLIGVFVFFWLVLCFSNWHRILLWLLHPIYWLLTGRRLLLP